MRERVTRFQICEYKDCRSPFVHRKTDEDGIVHCDSCGRTFREKRKEEKAPVGGGGTSSSYGAFVWKFQLPSTYTSTFYSEKN